MVIFTQGRYNYSPLFYFKIISYLFTQANILKYHNIPPYSPCFSAIFYSFSYSIFLIYETGMNTVPYQRSITGSTQSIAHNIKCVYKQSITSKKATRDRLTYSTHVHTYTRTYLYTYIPIPHTESSRLFIKLSLISAIRLVKQ